MNTVEVVFPDHIHTAEASPSLWQWDYGQRLIITGAPLPDSYEVHFCNAGDEGTKSTLGDMTGVDIPDEYLQTGKNIFAYIYLHTGMDDGETVYKITIKVKPRARPTEMFLTDVQHNALDQAIAQLEKYANATRNVDSLPTENSGNLITSGAVYDAINNTQAAVNNALANKQNALTFDNEPAAGSSNPVKSSGIHAALTGKQSDLTQVPVVTSLQETDFLFLERAGAIYKIRASAVIIPSGDTSDVVESDAVTTESGEQLLTEENEIINID